MLLAELTGSLRCRPGSSAATGGPSIPHLAARLRILGMTSTSLLWLASEADSSIPLPEELLKPCAPSESSSSEPSACTLVIGGQLCHAMA